MINPPQPSFWVFIEPMVSDEIKTQLMALRDSESDVMKCRSWLRIMLTNLSSCHFWRTFSDILDSSRLSTIQLGYDYTISSLTTWDSSVLQKADLAGLISPNTRRDGERVSPPPTSRLEWVWSHGLSRYSRSHLSLSLQRPRSSPERQYHSRRKEGHHRS
ncbi:hypothetical protein GBAR_LOCUS18325 [Geodia barretti]|uniref:Uncharacterized protein n=1 Tax=Geodia barretti TaxID=519541 RepID=A0AA35SPM6_GEOBA|nr:hypothetical protein GBAR_LOCUS18325 [Geodia barretti]